MESKNIGVSLASTIIIIAGVMASKSIIMPILLAFFISIVCTQPILWLEKKKIPYTISIFIVLTGVASILVLLGSIIARSISNFMRDLPQYESNLKNMFSSSIQQIKDLTGINLDTSLLVDLLDPGNVISFTTNTLSQFGGIMSDSFVILLVTIFVLLEAKSFLLKAEIIGRVHDVSLSYLDKIGQSIRNYLTIKTLISLLTGFLVWLWLLVQGVDYAVLWGVIAFMLNYIPNIGSIIAAVPTALLSLVQLGVGGMVWTIVGYFLVNTVMGSIVEPKVLGKGLGLSTLVVFLSLIVWGFIFGPVGMFLSVPLTMTIKIMLDETKKTQWIGTLLGGEKDAKRLLDQA